MRKNAFTIREIKHEINTHNFDETYLKRLINFHYDNSNSR